MTEPIQRFRYPGPQAAGARAMAAGRSTFNLCGSDNVISTVQVLETGVHNALHLHLVEDGYWLVLGGRARFHGAGETILAELGKFEGVLIPAGTRYWFESVADEPLELLRVNYRVHPGPRRIDYGGWVKDADVPPPAGAAEDR
jgi:mannose-6-phosphate isomerase-like protein (cupin superfamily)